MESSNPSSSQSAMNISFDYESLPAYQDYLEILVQTEHMFMEDEAALNVPSSSDVTSESGAARITTNINYGQSLEKILSDENHELSSACEKLKNMGVSEGLSTYMFKLLASYTIKNHKKYNGSTENKAEKIYDSLDSNLPILSLLMKSHKVPPYIYEKCFKTVIRSSLNYYRNNFFDLLLEDWTCWQELGGRFTTIPPLSLSSSPGQPSNIRGRFTTSPHICSTDKDTLHVFIRDSDKNLLHCLRNSEEFGEWERIEGQAASAPCAVSLDDKNLVLFAKGCGNVLLHRFYKDHWQPWTTMGGNIVSAPTACLTENGDLHIFARGRNNDLVHIVSDPEGLWSSWESLGGEINSAPSCVSWGGNRVDVFARGKGNNMYHIYLSDNQCGLWENLGGRLTSAPSATSRTASRLDVFARGSENQLLWRSWKGVCWSDWIDLGGYLTSAPSAASMEPHRIDVFAKGAGDKLIYISNK
ncbi:hypothetical protein [Clostridium thermarum]|uniref:hypothetical protein n=1 Tax=Clostridium thermarum TaxID=1716543 RepID=UPI00111D4441|nr:hypothetical protein [Clostridium thermarum]